MSEWILRLREIVRADKNAGRIIFIIGIAGMLLILASEFWPTQAKSSACDTATESLLADYEAKMEQRLETLIQEMDGAGKTSVMVTLESGEWNRYAVDTKTGDTTAEQTHVLLDDGNALTETVYMPEIRGVAVVCEGGDQVHVIAQITEMLSSLLGLSTSRISVTKMN